MSLELRPLVMQLHELDEGFVSGTTSTHFIAVRRGHGDEVIVEANRAGLVHLAAQLLKLADSSNDCSHYHLDEAGMADASDEEQLEFATVQHRVLFSYNASDFQRIHTEYLTAGKSHAGIILAPQQRFTIGDQIRLLLRLINAKSAEEMHDRLEFLSNWL